MTFFTGFTVVAVGSLGRGSRSFVGVPYFAAGIGVNFALFPFTGVTGSGFTGSGLGLFSTFSWLALTVASRDCIGWA